ncbi:probable disease resistance protein At1g58390 [Salvia miltiorrhiza]|uniref:probable disease resistance protein At1g58390 n=1 Tax=Salvia miltiorrhiza TaxID=226208 RepID=UPI0025AB8F4D|nr:probable disease resistance protein At1g58390 [Salvia miltiorrhiza]
MAEAVVSTALETLRDLLLEEARFLYGVGDEVKELEWQLKEMKCLLKDADRRRHESETIFNWISEIKDLVYRAEAAIERHAAYQVTSTRRRGLRQLVHRCSCSLEKCYSIHKLGSEISPIKSRLERINKEMLESGIKKSIINNTDEGESSSANNRARKSFPEFEIGDCFVGMKDELKQLLHLLVEDEKHRVISVWGMGGSGKTTIAKKLYNETNTSFDLSAWVCISQQCQSFQSVWKDVLKQLEHQNTKDGPKIREDVTSLNEWELKERLCKIQRDKRCLIVFDDLWETSHWDGFKHPFLVQDLQSKILITTREREVAEIGCPVKLGLLKEEDALELLEKKAFPHTNIPEFALEDNFKKIGKEMVQKCGYLPLAISLLGGVLRMKNSMKEWELVNEDIKEFIYRVLNLSYESLPYYLKPCFLYMGLFEEDEDINVEDLYRMWIAQGMISYENIGDKDKTLYEIAELYLGELASRSIVQVEIYDGVTPGRKYRSCKLHDVVRELCLKLGRSEDFGAQSLEYQSGKASSHRKILHLAIRFRKEVQVEPDELTLTWGEDSTEHLRSLQMFSHINSGVVEFPPQGIVDLQKFKLLRDLGMVGFKFEGRKLSKGITSLVHLRRLCLEKCEFDKLPLSIRNLIYMDTLDLSYSMNVGVPNVFKEMLRLKHLFLPDYDKEKIGSYRLTLDEGVIELETLSNLDSRVIELWELPKLREWRVEAGAMPLLSHLQIDECPNLEMLPDGLNLISTLQELEIIDTPELGKRVSASGEDFQKISHVPSIIIKNY